MPKVRRSRKPPPDGWELIEPTLEELEQKMREGIFSYTNVINIVLDLGISMGFHLLRRIKLNY